MVGLPKGLCNITSLKMLSISNCHKLFELPQEIGNLVNLKLLRLSSFTDLEGIPNTKKYNYSRERKTETNRDSGRESHTVKLKQS